MSEQRSSNAVDAHCHVFDPARFPFAAPPAYQPPPHEVGTALHLAAVHDAHGISHALLVNPTGGYGYDNGCMMAAIRAFPTRFRGIARVPPDADARALRSLADGGVIGLRLDLVADGLAVLQHPALTRLFAQARELGWLLQVQCEGDQLADAAAATPRRTPAADLRSLRPARGRSWPRCPWLPRAARIRARRPRRQAVRPVSFRCRATDLLRRRAVRRGADRRVHRRPLRLGVRLAVHAHCGAHRLRSRARDARPLAP